MHQIQFRLGIRSDLAGGVYRAPADPLAGFKGPISKGGRGKEGGEEWEGSPLLFSANLRSCWPGCTWTNWGFRSALSGPLAGFQGQGRRRVERKGSGKDKRK